MAQLSQSKSRKYKSVKKVSGVRKVYRKWEDWDIGDIVIGKFTGIHIDQYKKECPMIEVEEAFFKAKKEGAELVGKTLVINHTGMIGSAFSKISEGTCVQITYDGKSLIEKGPYKGKDAHVTLVEEVEEIDENDQAYDEDEEVEL